MYPWRMRSVRVRVRVVGPPEWWGCPLAGLGAGRLLEPAF
jgi:hypothetical protein